MRKIRAYIKDFIRLNILKTLYFNFKCFPLSIALKFPVHLYGKVVIHSLKGQVSIDGPVYGGMIKIGYRWHDLFPSSFLTTQLYILGSLSFEGRCIMSGGVGVFIQSTNASIFIGDEVSIGGGTLLKSMDKLLIGRRTSITSNCVIMNTNMHIIKNVDTGIVKKPWGPILIGESCWINSGTVVSKGTVVPNYSITARNAFLNKDYSEFGTHLFLVGSPAKVSSSKVQRIFGHSMERKLLNYFRKESPLSEEIYLHPGEESDLGNHF